MATALRLLAAAMDTMRTTIGTVPHAQGGQSPWHLHDAPPAMALALIVLAIGSVLAGYVGVPAALGGHNEIEHYLAPSFAAHRGHGRRGSLQS